VVEIQALLPAETMVHVVLGMVLTIVTVILSFLISGEMAERKWIQPKNRLLVTIIAMLLTGIIFSASSAPGSFPIASDSLQFSADGTGNFIVQESPYLSDYVYLEGGGGTTGAVTVTSIRVEFHQDGQSIRAVTVSLGITSESYPFHEGSAIVELQPGEYDVEAVVPDFCWVNIEQIEIDGRSIAQRVWDDLKLDYLLVQGILVEFTIVIFLVVRRSLEAKQSPSSN